MGARLGPLNAHWPLLGTHTLSLIYMSSYFKMRLGSTLDLQKGIPKGRPKKTSIKPQLCSPKAEAPAKTTHSGPQPSNSCSTGASQQTPIPELGLPRCVPPTVKDKAGDVNEAFETVITLTGEMLAQGHL